MHTDRRTTSELGSVEAFDDLSKTKITPTKGYLESGNLDIDYDADCSKTMETPLFFSSYVNTGKSDSTKALFEPSPLHLSQNFDHEDNLISLHQDEFSLNAEKNVVSKEGNETEAFSSHELYPKIVYNRARSFSIHNEEDSSYLAKHCKEYIRLYLPHCSRTYHD